MNCTKCGREFDPGNSEERIISISGSMMGDETTDTYYFCQVCEHYTIEVYYDRFLGESEVSVSGPLTRSEGEQRIAIIRRCNRPWDKTCRCEAHMEYFNGCLD